MNFEIVALDKQLAFAVFQALFAITQLFYHVSIDSIFSIRRIIILCTYDVSALLTSACKQA